MRDVSFTSGYPRRQGVCVCVCVCAWNVAAAKKKRSQKSPLGLCQVLHGWKKAWLNAHIMWRFTKSPTFFYRKNRENNQKKRCFRDQTHDQTLAPFFGARFNGQDFRSECKIQQSHQRLMGTMEVDGCWWFLSESSEGCRLNIDRTRSCYSDLPWYLGHFGPLWVWSDVSLLGKFVCTGTHYWGPGWLGSVEPDLWQAQ